MTHQTPPPAIIIQDGVAPERKTPLRQLIEQRLGIPHRKPPQESLPAQQEDIIDEN